MAPMYARPDRRARSPTWRDEAGTPITTFLARCSAPETQPRPGEVDAERKGTRGIWWAGGEISYSEPEGTLTLWWEYSASGVSILVPTTRTGTRSAAHSVNDGPKVAAPRSLQLSPNRRRRGTPRKPRYVTRTTASS